FEPATPASRTQCSTGLSYSPHRLMNSVALCNDGPTASWRWARNSKSARTTDRVGFEPTRVIHPTRFPIVLLKPLGHLSFASSWRYRQRETSRLERRGWDSNPR